MELKHSVLVILIFLIVLSCKQGGKPIDNSPKYKQYYVQGQQLYQQYCSNCHQQNGKGLGRVYPPLDKSDFLDSQLERVICLIKFGSKEEMVVNGISYNMEMKANPQLTELEIAEITTYLYNTWGRQEGLIDVKRVAGVLARCN